MKVAITGGSGFLGSNLSNLIASKGHQVKIIDNFYRNSDQYINKNIEIFNCDIRNENSLIEYSKDADVLIHLAFINGTKYFYEKPELVLDVGVRGMLNSINAIKKNKIKKFILASSSEVYNEPINVPTSENEMIKIPDINNPRFSYSSGKIISESLTINSLNNIEVEKIIFRPHNIFGPKMGEEHVIPEIVKKIYMASNKFKDLKCSIEIQGDGSETRAFCYVSDAINQIFFLIENGKNNNVYNVGISKEISILNLINLISDILKIKDKIINSNIKLGSAKRRCPDISKIKDLGYKLNDNFHDGLISTVLSYKEYYLKNN